MNEQITKRDGIDHKPRSDPNNYVYVGGLSLFGLAIRGYLLNTYLLDSSLKELKQFNNVHHVFLCKIPPRFDCHNVNIKVNQYNNILSECFSDSEHISVIDTIPPEFRFYYIHGLHFSNLGLDKVCRIILSHLYKVLAPSSYKKRKGASKNRS